MEVFAVLTDHLGHSGKQKPSGINRSLSEFCAAEFLCIGVSTATLKTNYFADLGFSFFASFSQFGVCPCHSPGWRGLQSTRQLA